MALKDQPMPAERWSVLAIALILLTIACGGGEDEPGSPADGGPARTDPAPAATPADGQPDQPPAGSEDDQTIAVNQTLWNYGFQWEVLEATLFGEVHRLLGREHRNLHVKVRLTNLSDRPGAFRGRAAAVFEQGGQQHAATTTSVHIEGFPLEIAGGESVEGELRFAVDPAFDFERGFLVIGEPGENQAALPFGSSGPPLRDLAPYVLDPSGQVTMELFDISLTQGRVTADRMHSHGALPRGERSLYLFYDFTHRRQGSRSLGPPSFELTFPDGSSSEPANWGPAYANLAAETTHSLWLRFPLPSEEFAGEYALTFTPGGFAFQGTDEEDTHTLSFTLAP